MTAEVTPATKHDKGRAEAARSLENPGDSAAQRALTVQPMSHLPRDRAEVSISAGSVRNPPNLYLRMAADRYAE